jgi:hypothetical protein
MPIGQSHISVSRINRKKRPEAEALQKQKKRTVSSAETSKDGAPKSLLFCCPQI